MMILWILSCKQSVVEAPEKKLAEASMKVTFASVEQLGAHRYEAVIKRSEFQGERLERERTELLKIDWLN